MKASVSSSWWALSFNVRYVKACYYWMCSYGLKTMHEQTDKETDIRADSQTGWQAYINY